VISSGDRIFVDTGAFVALSVMRDAHHTAAAALWSELIVEGGKPFTSVPVVIETYTYFRRKLGPDVAETWRQALLATPRLMIVECTVADLSAAWPWLQRKDLHKLSLVDASSFVLMKKHKLRRAFSFDAHFAAAGFMLLRS
jgi:predicted nucleic acid-binding protein